MYHWMVWYRMVLPTIFLTSSIVYVSNSEYTIDNNDPRTTVNSAGLTEEKLVHENKLRLEYLDLKVAKLLDEYKDLSNEFQRTAPW